MNSFGGRHRLKLTFHTWTSRPYFFAAGDALLDLVALVAERVAARQHVAGVMGLAGPEHVGQDHVEAVLGQQLRAERSQSPG